MKKPLILLPFVHGIDLVALSLALAFAEKMDASILLVAFILTPRKGRHVRPEVMAQAADFFAATSYRASQMNIPVYCLHYQTQQIVESIQKLVHEKACQGVFLFVRDGNGVFLETHYIKDLIVQVKEEVYIFRLQPHVSLWSRFWRWLLHSSGINLSLKHGSSMIDDSYIPSPFHQDHVESKTSFTEH